MDNSSPDLATPVTAIGPWRAELTAAWRGLTRWQRGGLRVLVYAALVAWASQLVEMPWRSVFRGTDNSHYYFWLRSMMVDGDWNFRNDAQECDTWPSEDYRQEMLAQHLTPTGRLPNKYGIGWAVVSVPAYMLADGVVGAGRRLGIWSLARDGYNPVYQIALYGWHFGLAGLGLFLAWRCARRWADPASALLGVTLLWGASPLLYYQTIKLSMSHSISFLAVAAMTWALLRTREAPGRSWWWALAGAGWGLALITRFQLAVFAVVPAWLWWRMARAEGARAATRAAAGFVVGALPLLIIQGLAWHAVYGRWLVFTYGEQGEGFNWLAPEWFGGLLSARHGLLYWHPFLLAGVVGLAWLAWRRDVMAFGAAVALGLVIYVNAAWWCWWFAASFGQRAFDGAIVFLMLGLAYLLSRLPDIGRSTLCLIGGLAAVWNYYVMILFYTTAISRDGPVTWGEMLGASAKAWGVIARFLHTVGL